MTTIKNADCVEVSASVPKDSKVILAIIGVIGALIGGAGVSAPGWMMDSAKSTAQAQAVASASSYKDLESRLDKLESAITLQAEQLKTQLAKLDLLIQTSPYIKSIKIIQPKPRIEE